MSIASIEPPADVGQGSAEEVKGVTENEEEWQDENI